MKKMMKNMEVVMNRMMITMETHIRRRKYLRKLLPKTQLVRREAVNQKAKLKRMLNKQKNKQLQQQLLEHLKFNRQMPLKNRLIPLKNQKEHLLILKNQMVNESLELVLEDYHLILKFISQLSRNTNPQRKRVKPIINLAKIPQQKSNKPLKQMEKLKPIMKTEMR